MSVSVSVDVKCMRVRVSGNEYERGWVGANVSACEWKCKHILGGGEGWDSRREWEIEAEIRNYLDKSVFKEEIILEIDIMDTLHDTFHLLSCQENITCMTKNDRDLVPS